MNTPSTRKPVKKVQSEATPEAHLAAMNGTADAAAAPRKAKPARKNGHAQPDVAQPSSVQTANEGAEAKPKRAKKESAKKEKVIRDSFTMPKSDYEKIAVLKQKCLEAGIPVKKSELLRAGLSLLQAIPVKRLAAAIAALETVKTGRPKQSQ